MLVVGIVILIVAYFQPPAIMMISYFAATLFASSWGPVAFMSVWSKRITADGAFWGIVVGFVGNLIPKVLSVFEVIYLPVYLVSIRDRHRIELHHNHSRLAKGPGHRGGISLSHADT